MKKLMMVAIAGLLVFAFAGTVLAFDEEEKDISKRHEAWLGKVMVGQIGREQVKAEGKVQEKDENGVICTEMFLPDGDFKFIKDVREHENDAVLAAKKDLCERLGIDEKKIEDFGSITTDVMQTQTWPIPSTTVEIYTIGLVYKGNTYIYDAKTVWHFGKVSEVSVEFTGEIIPTEYDDEGNLILEASELKQKQYDADESLYVSSENNDYLPENDASRTYIPVDYEKTDEEFPTVIPGEWYSSETVREPAQRKAIEAQIQLKGNGENYTFSGQMADQPKEAVPLQKKQ